MAVKPTVGRVAFLRRADDARLDEVASRLADRGFSVDFYADPTQTARGVSDVPTDLLIVTDEDRHVFEDQYRVSTPMLVLPHEDAPPWSDTLPTSTTLPSSGSKWTAIATDAQVPATQQLAETQQPADTLKPPDTRPPDTLASKPPTGLSRDNGPTTSRPPSSGPASSGPTSMTGLFVSAIERIFSHDTEAQAEEPHVHGRLQQLASLGLVASGVAHELSTPLSSLWMDLNTLQRALENEPALQDSLSGAFDAVERMRQIIVDVRELSRTEDPSTAHTDVRGVLDRAIRLLRPRLLHARVVRDYLSVPLVTAADGRLDQLFINLLSNAADALPEDDPDGHNEIVVSTRSGPQGTCVVEVRDNGSGIAEEDVPHIFETFFTTKEASRGTGLGLSLCRGVVASLGGEIQVESELRRGTTFRVVLPGRRRRTRER